MLEHQVNTEMFLRFVRYKRNIKCVTGKDARASFKEWEGTMRAQLYREDLEAGGIPTDIRFPESFIGD